MCCLFLRFSSQIAYSVIKEANITVVIEGGGVGCRVSIFQISISLPQSYP